MFNMKDILEYFDPLPVSATWKASDPWNAYFGHYQASSGLPIKYLLLSHNYTIKVYYSYWQEPSEYKVSAQIQELSCCCIYLILGPNHCRFYPYPHHPAYNNSDYCRFM